MTDQRTKTSLTERAGAAFAQYIAGDASGLESVVRTTTPLLWHVARGCGLDSATVEDVLQTAWLRLVSTADAITEPAAVLGWLVTTVRRESWRVAKLASRARPTEELPEDAWDRPPDDDPAELVGALDEQSRLWAHVRRLSPRCQTLLRVIAAAGPPDYAALSQALGMPVGSIGPTRGRCLATLRRNLLADPSWSAS